MSTAGDPSETPRPLSEGFTPPGEAQWRALVDKVLKGDAFESSLISRTDDGLDIRPLYTRADEPGARAATLPGKAPFTRGSAVRMQASGWRIAQLRTESDAQALRAAIAEDVAGGAEAITIRLAAPGQSGIEADFRTIEAALDGVPLDRVRMSLQPGSQSIHGSLGLIGVARSRGVLASVAGLGIDPLGTLARTGELHLLRQDSHRLALGLPWLPSPGTTLVADARPYHEAGASVAQELAALASTLVAYLRALEGEGISPRGGLPRIGLAMAVDADLFLGIAKLRAARQLVWRVADTCGAGEAAGAMQFCVTTSERMMSRRDPWVNMLRVTAATTAAAIGGADEISVLPFTWALGQPDAFARRIGRNVGLVLREEASLGRVIDAAGGAWHVERLTDELAQKAWSIFQEWEGEGGMLASLRAGLVQDQIAAVAEARAAQLATGRIELTGTSAFPSPGSDTVNAAPWPIPRPVPAPAVCLPLPPRRLAEPFEVLRDEAETLGTGARVFLASLGTPAEHGARTTWATNLLASGGVGVIAGEGFTSSGEAGGAFAGTGARIACICGTAESYELLGEAVAMALKSAGASRVYLAGRPGKYEAALRAAGVDAFLFAGMNRLEALASIHQDLGIVLR